MTKESVWIRDDEGIVPNWFFDNHTNGKCLNKQQLKDTIIRICGEGYQKLKDEGWTCEDSVYDADSFKVDLFKELKIEYVERCKECGFPEEDCICLDDGRCPCCIDDDW